MPIYSGNLTNNVQDFRAILFLFFKCFIPVTITGRYSFSVVFKIYFVSLVFGVNNPVLPLTGHFCNVNLVRAI